MLILSHSANLCTPTLGAVHGGSHGWPFLVCRLGVLVGVKLGQQAEQTLISADRQSGWDTHLESFSH